MKTRILEVPQPLMAQVAWVVENNKIENTVLGANLDRIIKIWIKYEDKHEALIKVVSDMIVEYIKNRNLDAPCKVKQCLYCGSEFRFSRATAKYCSDNCKQMAYYVRHGLILANSRFGNKGTESNIRNATVSELIFPEGTTLKFDQPVNISMLRDLLK